MKNLFLAAAAALIAGPMTAHAVIVGGDDWRQLTETGGFTWNQVASVCSEATGVCSGSLGAVSFDDWIWADNIAIQALFDELILPGTVQFPTDTSAYFPFDSVDNGIDAVMSQTTFEPTTSSAASESIAGLSRTSVASDLTFARLPGVVNFLTTPSIDIARLDSVFGKSSALDVVGVWLYRPVTVPEPGTLALLCVAFIPLALSRWRRASSRYRWNS